MSLTVLRSAFGQVPGVPEVHREPFSGPPVQYNEERTGLSLRRRMVFSQTASASTYVSVRENYTITNLVSALDALMADVGASSPLSSVPAMPRLTANSDNNASGVFQTLKGSFTGSLSFGTAAPYQGTGQSSTSAVAPYSLAFDGSNDSLSLSTALNSAANFGIETWLNPGAPATPGSMMITNASGTATTNGFQLRQSTTPPGRAEFVVGKKYYSYRDYVLSLGPVGYWRLNETSGTTALDLSAQGNHGTYIGGYTLGQTGALTGSGDSDPSIILDGTSGYVSVPDSGSLVFGNGDFSIAAWVNTTATNTYVAVGKYNGGGGDNYWLGFSNAGQAAFSISGPTTYSPLNSNDGQWHFLVGMRSAGTISIYVDGAFQNSTMGNGAASPAGVFSIGRFGAGSNFFWPNGVDDVAVYNYALSSTQIANLYTSGATAHGVEYPGNGVLANNPLAYWRLGERSGHTAYDYSGNNYNLVYSNDVTLGQFGALSGAGDLDTSVFSTSSSSAAISEAIAPQVTDFSLSAWVKWTLTSTASCMIDLIGNSFGFSIGNGSGGSGNIVGIYLSGIVWDVLGSSYTLPTSQWVHLVATHTGPHYSLYANGSLVKSTTSATVPQSPTTTSYAFYQFPGWVDEAAYYDYALSPTQVSALYNSGNGAGWWFCQSQTGLSSSRWNLLSSLYNGTLAQLFVNGQPECSVTPGTTYTPAAGNTTVGSAPGSASFWQGLMNYLGLYASSGTPLTNTNMNHDFAATANRFRPVPIEDIVTSGIVLHYDPANAQSGTAPFTNGCAASSLSYFDLSPNAQNGTLNGYSSCTTDGWRGSGTVASPYALVLNGTTDAMTVGPFSFDVTSVTVAAWANTSANDDGKIFCPSGLSCPLGIYFGQARSCSGFGSCISGGAVNDGNWHHLVFVGTSTMQTLYIDGSVAVASPGTYSGISTGSNAYFGGASGTLFTGSLGPMMVWNVPLTAAQVKQNCLAQEHRFTATPQSICAAP